MVIPFFLFTLYPTIVAYRSNSAANVSRRNRRQVNGWVMHLIISVIAVAIADYFIAGVDIGMHSGNYGKVILAGVVLGLLNSFVKPIVNTLALPLRVMTLGLFTFVVNGCMVLLAAWVVPFHAGFFSAILFSIVVSIISWLLNIIF